MVIRKKEIPRKCCWLQKVLCVLLIKREFSVFQFGYNIQIRHGMAGRMEKTTLVFVFWKGRLFAERCSE